MIVFVFSKAAGAIYAGPFGTATAMFPFLKVTRAEGCHTSKLSPTVRVCPRG